MRNIYVERGKALTSFYTLCKKTSITHRRRTKQRQPPFLVNFRPDVSHPSKARTTSQREQENQRQTLHSSREGGKRVKKKKKNRKRPSTIFFTPYMFPIRVLHSRRPPVPGVIAFHIISAPFPHHRPIFPDVRSFEKEEEVEEECKGESYRLRSASCRRLLSSASLSRSTRILPASVPSSSTSSSNQGCLSASRAVILRLGSYTKILRSRSRNSLLKRFVSGMISSSLFMPATNFRLCLGVSGRG